MSSLSCRATITR